jgi:lysophospholipase L1-like esterase
MKKTILILLFALFNIFVKSQSINIVFDGDSQTSWGVWPSKIIELLQSSGYSNIRNINYAISGQTTSQMVNDVASQVVPRYNSSYSENIVLYYIGYNDTWAGNSLDIVTLHNRLATYYNTLKSAGFKVLMINLPDGLNRTGISVINNMFYQQNKDISDIFVNCRETGGIFEDYHNTTYYRDDVHLNETGCNYLAEHYVYPKLLNLMDISVPVDPPVNNLLSGLESYWKLDESSGNAKDETSSNVGIVSSGVTRTTGKVNGGYYFDNNSDYITLSKYITLKTGTYSFWINISSITDDLLILGSNGYYSRIFIGANNNLKLETNTNGQEFAFYTSFNRNTWYHITLVRNNDNLTFYRDGNYISSTSISNSANLTLSQIGFNGRSFRGTIDEIGIWSRALTPGEINVISKNSYPFNNTIEPPDDDSIIEPPIVNSLTTSLRAYWKLDETSGNAKDEVNSNTGIVSSGVTRISGRVNGAYYFDSNSDYINLSSIITQKTATYSFWIRILSITDDLLIMGNNGYYSRIFIGANNNIKLETNTNGQEFAFYNSFSTGMWYHIALVRDGDNLKFYRNGIYVGSNYISNSANLTLSQIGFNGRSFRGAIDEIGIWDRALTAQEVVILSNGNSYPFNSLKSTKNIEDVEDILFYPNPVKEELHVLQNSNVEIYDLNGKLLIKKENKDLIDVSELSNGIYLLKIMKEGIIYNCKLIKQ